MCDSTDPEAHISKLSAPRWHLYAAVRAALVIGREDVDESFGPASVVLRGYGRRVGAGTWSDLSSGLTPHLGCLETGPSPGSRSFRHPPALPVRSAWPGQEAGVSQIGGQRVRAIPQPQKKGRQ